MALQNLLGGFGFVAGQEGQSLLNRGQSDQTKNRLTVLQRLAKKKKGVNVIIYTDPKTKLTSQDIQAFNAQYPTITLNHTTKMHDRFLIIDDKVHLLGASLKDMGTGLCAVTEISITPETIMELLK